MSPEVAQEIRFRRCMGPAGSIAHSSKQVHFSPVFDTCDRIGGPLLFGECGIGWPRER